MTWLILKKYDSNSPKIDKNPYKNNDMYYIRYITITNIGDYESIHSVNPLYFIIGEVYGCIEEKMEIK